MTKAIIAFLIALVVYGVQDYLKPADQSLSAETLGFEGQHKGDMPQGWAGGPAGTIFTDGKTVHSGQWAVRLERNAESPSQFTAISQAISMDFSGATVELRGFLRTQDVAGSAGLWMREDGETPALEFDNMQGRHLQGSTEWTEYSIKLPVRPEAKKLIFGALLSGTGKMWADDLQLFVDGKPIQEAPKVERPKTAIDLDHEFDAGSGVSLNSLTKIQIENLARLGKVWGFLKYHHPLVTSGGRHWDYELFRILPAVAAAPDRQTANAAMLRWITAMGPVTACNPCAKLDETELQLRPDLGWLSDEKRLGADLSRSLRAIYDSRPAAGPQFYAALFPQIGNPDFRNEPAYEKFKFPDPGFRILSVYRFWNIIEYWSPNRDVVGENWDEVLAEFIPRIVAAGDADAYQREMMALIAKIHDSHANLWSSLQVRPPVGSCALPVNLRFVGDRAVVAGYPPKENSAKDVPDTGLKIGDVITELEGVPVRKLVKKWTPLYAASNDVVRLHDIAAYMTRGECGRFSIGVLRGRQKFTLETWRVPAGPNVFSTHDRPGETFQILPGNVAYLKLSSVKAADAAHYVESAASTKGLIIDIRNYPSEFMVFTLGSLLVSQETPFARFSHADLANPGAFHWYPPMLLKPQSPHYPGKVVVLVDETSQSQAEYTSMAFRSATGAVVIGSTTAGADGNVSRFALPGGLLTMISGLGVFYPDKRPTQRIGIIPDVVVKPTVEGIRAGKDEVLEEALRRILQK